jgi:glycogen synthase
MLMERAISRDFSWQMVAERYERVYEQLGLKAVA